MDSFEHMRMLRAQEWMREEQRRESLRQSYLKYKVEEDEAAAMRERSYHQWRWEVQKGFRAESDLIEFEIYRGW